MRKLLLAVVTVAAVGLSAGAASADVVCSPVCGLVTPAEAQNLKQNDGKKNAATHMSQQGLNHNNAGISLAPPPPSPGPIVLF